VNYDTDALIQRLKTRGLIPTANTAWASTDFLTALSDEIDLTYLPMLLKSRGDHICISATSPVLQGQTQYLIPSRCAANGFRYLGITDPNGNYFPLPQLELSQLPAIGAGNQLTGNPKYFWLQGSYINVYPIPAASGQWTLQLYFYYKPSKLVATSAVMAIGAINPGAKTVTVTTIVPSNNVPATYTKLDGDGNPVLYDFVRGKPPFDIISLDQPLASNPSAGVVTMANALPNGLATGDYLCLSGQTAVPNLPEILHSAIAVRAAAICLKATGDYSGAQALLDDAARLDHNAMVALAPRSRGNARKLINRNWL